METGLESVIKILLGNVAELALLSGASFQECLEHFEQEFWMETIDMLALDILEGAK